MAASFSLYVVMTRSLRTETTRANLFYTALGVFIALSPLMHAVWITPTRHDFVVMVAVGVIGLACLYALDRAVAAAPASESAPLTSTQAVFTLGAGAVLGHFHSSPAVWAGLALVGAAAALAWWCASQLTVRQAA